MKVPRLIRRTSPGGRGLAAMLIAVAVLLGSCGTDGQAPEATDTSADSPLTPVQQEIYDELLLIPEGFTEAEALCVARILGDGAATAQDGLDRTADYSSGPEALLEETPGCVTAERAAEIEEAQMSLNAELSDEMDAAFQAQFEGTFADGGATADEATCLASALVSTDPEDFPPLYGTYDSESPELVLFAECGTPERIAEIYTDAYLRPMRAGLMAAGADSEEEADCVAAAVGDLFFPSEDWSGETAAEKSADLFARDAAHCAAEEHLRELALELHRQYTEGGQP